MHEFQQTKQVELSLIILCYRAEERVREFVSRVQTLFSASGIIEYELILVGNYLPGINDITPEVVKDLSQKFSNIRYCALPKLGMMGWDMRSGLDVARGKYVAVIDGDGQMPVEDVVKVYEKIRHENLGLVKTVRMKRGDNAWRKIISFIYNTLFHMLFPGMHAQDINAKPKIFLLDTYKHMHLLSNDWFIDAEIMICARRMKLTIGEVPTVFLGLTGRRSFVRFSAIFEFIKNLFIFRMREFYNVFKGKQK